MYREPEKAVRTPFLEWCFFIAFSLLPTGKPLILWAALLIKRRIEVFPLRSINKPLQTSEKTSLYSILSMDAIRRGKAFNESACPMYARRYLCRYYSRCRSDIWNCLECFHFIPKKNSSSILRSRQRLGGRKRKYSRTTT